MNNGEYIEANLSALIDGELTGEELLETVDALSSSPELQRLYARMRGLRELVGPPLDFTREERLPPDLWPKINRRSGLGRAKIIRLFTDSPARAWAAAAVILLGIGLSSIGLFRLPTLRAGDDVISVTLGENKGKMTEERFIALTTELLRADRRYHRKMLEVLEAVTAENIVTEGSVEETPRRNQPAEETNEGDGQTQRRRTAGRSDPIELRLW